MTDLRLALPTTPRLLVVGLIVFGSACRRQQPAVVVPTPEPPQPVQVAPVPVVSTPVVTAITSGEALIQAMYDRYAATWYHTVTFMQRTTVSLASGRELTQTWYEARRLPGWLRIDTDLESKSGVLYTRDSVYRFTNGKLAQGDTGSNELLVLGFDIYTQSPAQTEAILRRQGFDLASIHESTWEGKAVYVVGAPAGDSAAKQFWIEQDRLLFVRMLQNTRRGRSDTRFGKYVPAGQGWIAVQVEQRVNGKRTLLEEYSDVRTDVALRPELFDPRQWAVVPHWTR